jgi:hypothetical protein
MNKNNLPIYLSIAVVFGILIGAFFNGGSGVGFSFVGKTPSEIKIKRLLNPLNPQNQLTPHRIPDKKVHHNKNP